MKRRSDARESNYFFRGYHLFIPVFYIIFVDNLFVFSPNGRDRRAQLRTRTKTVMQIGPREKPRRRRDQRSRRDRR